MKQHVQKAEPRNSFWVMHIAIALSVLALLMTLVLVALAFAPGCEPPTNQRGCLVSGGGVPGGETLQALGLEVGYLLGTIAKNFWLFLSSVPGMLIMVSLALSLLALQRYRIRMHN